MPEEEEREKLAKVIQQWNNNRLDLFEISQPDENSEFHGVMRFYFEDHVGGNVATKCLRVCSNSSTHQLIETLSEKFRADMKMLSTRYTLYEIHGNKERKMDPDERPLLVQLHWTSDNREGRFVLKKDKDSLEENDQEKEKGGVIQNFKRTLSRKEKNKEKKKSEAAEGSEDVTGSKEKLLINRSVFASEHETRRQADPGSPYFDLSDRPGLPIRIILRENTEESFLSAVLHYTNSSTVHFKLSPAYVLYAVGRSALQRKPFSAAAAQMHSVTQIINKTVAMTERVIQKQKAIAGALAFWMANVSELLNFLRHDRDLSPRTQQSQLDLSNLVHKAYNLLLQCLQNELRMHLPTFLIDPEQYGPLPVGIELVLNTLMNTMSLLRRCRVNPALTIQLFSQLFHFISVWLFNQLMSSEANARGLRSHYWGAALRQRLMAIEGWAERQGLELAADCHLGHIIQATTLLTMNKYSMKDAKDIQNTCFKLNSLQLRTLLGGYLYASDEPRIPHALIDAVVAAANASSDNLIQSEGRAIQLEESLDLSLPFLLPEEGYSCDTVRGIPPGFREFLEPISQKGLCSLVSEGNSEGSWTVHFDEPFSSAACSASHKVPEVVTITLNKPLNSGMGVSIVAAKGAAQGNLGIYIKSVVKGGPADMNGNLTAGDQLLSVDGQSLVGLNQERAAAIMMQTGPVVTLQVAKFGANYHGLASLLGRSDSQQTSAGDESHANPHSKAQTVYRGGDSEYPYGVGKKKKDQIMLRNRQLYRSNPSMNTGFDDGDDPVDPAIRRTNMAAVSSGNLCADTFRREYLTLPNPKSQSKDMSESSQQQQRFKASMWPSEVQNTSKGTLMRQAMSQENLCTDKRENSWKQKDQHTKLNHNSSFPVHSSVSADDILLDHCSAAKQQQSSRPSGAGVWRTPFSQHSTPNPSTQPIRIDIPVTRAVQTQTNPPLMTFQSPSKLPLKMSQTVKVNGNAHRPQNQTHSHIYACPLPATKKLPQPSPPSLQDRPTTQRSPATKPQVGTTPTKHVSFQEPPPTKQKQAPGPQQHKDSLQLSGPWKREAQEKPAEQQKIHTVELLEQEVQELQAKAKRTAEENDRLRKLSLEWQFQKRLQEIQRRGEDEDEEGGEDLEMMMTIQQLEDRNQSRRSSARNGHTVAQGLDKQPGSPCSQEEGEAKTDQRSSKVTQALTNTPMEAIQKEKIKRTAAPEKLTFKERQSLFSLVPSA